MKEYIESRIKELQQSKQQHVIDATNSQANANGCEGAILELTSLLEQFNNLPKEETNDTENK